MSTMTTATMSDTSMEILTVTLNMGVSQTVIIINSAVY